ncbi:MAG: winged helix-turn-helix transcriptional regulator [Candidatus Woesearchaeota archaeon]
MAYLDQKDKIILEHLFQNATLSTKELAKYAKITQPATFMRLKRLEKEQFIERYDAIINENSLNVIKKGYLCTLTNERIKNRPECISLIHNIGIYTHHIVCWFKNKKQQEEFELLLPKNRYEYQVKHTHIQTPLLFDIQLKKQRIQPKVKPFSFDQHDCQLLKALCQGGARKTLRELQVQTNLPLTTLQFRKKRLIQNGYITYFVAQPGMGALHLKVHYFIIDTKATKKPQAKKMVFYEKTTSGYLICFLSQDSDDYFSTLRELYTQYQNDWTTHILLTNDGYSHLNRYPFEFLL